MEIIFKLRNYHFRSPILTDAPAYKIILSDKNWQQPSLQEGITEPEFLPALYLPHFMQQDVLKHNISSYL